MNIRLDDNIRIRLDASDVAILTKNEECAKDFHLNASHLLSIVISLDETSSCHITADAPKRIQVGISPSDLHSLTMPAHRKHGLDIGSVNIQLDMMKTIRREHTHDGVAGHE